MAKIPEDLTGFIEAPFSETIGLLKEATPKELEESFVRFFALINEKVLFLIREGSRHEVRHAALLLGSFLVNRVGRNLVRYSPHIFGKLEAYYNLLSLASTKNDAAAIPSIIKDDHSVRIQVLILAPENLYV
ncbi:MAG: hypothetical protein Q7S32_04500 [bacterium]|nr:hypothetical protein [bacterium]